MARMKGAELITEYLIANKIPYVFGICGHGNVGMLDALYDARDRIKLISPRHEQVRGPHGRRLFPREPRAGRHAHLLRSGLLQPGHVAAVAHVRFLGLARHHRQRADPAVQPRRRSRSSTGTTRRTSQVIRPVVKRSFQPTRVDMLPLALRQAMTTMLTGRPGPVNLDVPFNVFQEEADVEMPRGDGVHGSARAAAPRPRTSPRRSTAPAGAAARDLHRPRRDAVGGRQGADRTSRTSWAFPSSPRPTAWAAST